ncbi:MAG: plastocyanin/azurin family copper-binding protein [Gemmatimonadota bacterium]
MHSLALALALRRALVVVTLALSACGGGGGGGDAMTGPGPDPTPEPNPPAPPAPPPGNVLEIHLEGFSFEPAEPMIPVGTTVRWVNDSNLFHTVTPEGHSEWQRQTTTQQGVVFEHTFQNAGMFPYFCEPHRTDGMTGSITVQ